MGGHAETNRINHGNWRLPCGAAAFFSYSKIKKRRYQHEGTLEHGAGDLCGNRRMAGLLSGRLRRVAHRPGGVRGGGLHHRRDVRSFGQEAVQRGGL